MFFLQYLEHSLDIIIMDNDSMFTCTMPNWCDWNSGDAMFGVGIIFGIYL